MAKYRKIRTDIFTHERTAGLGAVGRDILLQGILANIAGLLERSVRSMARTAGVDEAAVESALAELERRGLVRWWPEIEVLWVVGAAGEQAQGKAWEAVRETVVTAPAAVRAAIVEKYGEKVGLSPVPAVMSIPSDAPSDALPDTPSDTPSEISAMGHSNQETGSREQEAENRKQRTGPRSRALPPPPPVPSDEADLDDPEVRSIGTPVPEPGGDQPAEREPVPPGGPRPAPPGGVDGEIHDIAWRHGEFLAAMKPGASQDRVSSARLSVRDDAGRRNMRRELDRLGLDGVIEVLRFGWAEVAAGRWEPDRVAFAFNKSGGWFAKLLAERANTLPGGQRYQATRGGGLAPVASGSLSAKSRAAKQAGRLAG